MIDPGCVEQKTVTSRHQAFLCPNRQQTSTERNVLRHGGWSIVRKSLASSKSHKTCLLHCAPRHRRCPAKNVDARPIILPWASFLKLSFYGFGIISFRSSMFRLFDGDMHYRQKNTKLKAGIKRKDPTLGRKQDSDSLL